MLIDAARGLHALAQQIESFLATSSASATFAAETAENAAPYDELLLGLRVNKGSGQQLTISDDR
jgi:hypothetical protein